MTISDWCQVVTAIVASISLGSNAVIRYKHSIYSVAKYVSVWADDNKLFISNQSQTTLYNVFVFTDLNVYECSWQEHLSRMCEFHNPYSYFETFPIKKIISYEFDPNPAAGGKHLFPAILFTDTNGHYWYRNPSGRLNKLHHSYMEELIKRSFVLGHVKA